MPVTSNPRALLGATVVVLCAVLGIRMSALLQDVPVQPVGVLLLNVGMWPGQDLVVAFHQAPFAQSFFS